MVNSGGYIPRNCPEARSHFESRPRTVIFRVTGANQNARKLLSPDLVNTDNGCLPRIFIKCNHKSVQCLIKKFRSCFNWYFRFFIYCISLLSLEKNPTNKRNAKNNVKAGQNAIKVLNNNNSIQIRKKTVKKRFTDGSLSSFTRFGVDVTDSFFHYYIYPGNYINLTSSKLTAVFSLSLYLQHDKHVQR